MERFYYGVMQSILGIYQTIEAYTNNMSDPNNAFINQAEEDDNRELDHIATYGEAAQNLSEGLENTIKGGVKGSADAIADTSDDIQITLEVVTVAYPPAAEVTVPLIGVTEVTSDATKLTSAAVDYSDGNSAAMYKKLTEVGENILTKKAGKKIGKYLTKDFKPTEQFEKETTKNTTNILTDWFKRTRDKITEKSTYQW